jgi:hypothetical protein
MASFQSVLRQALACAVLLLAFASPLSAADKASADKATFDDNARILAGMTPSQGSPLSKFTSDRSWQSHAKRFDQAWSQLESRQLTKIRAWSAAHVTQRKPVVFYMFSGPDFLYADAFYPGADTYVLSALEPVGEIPDLDGISGSQLAGGLGRIEGSLNSVLSYSFFITKKMRHELSGGRFSGTLPILYVFLARSGKTITDVSLVALDADAKVIPDAAGTKSAAHGVKIGFTGKDGKAQTLYYFSTDISDSGLKNNPILKFCEGLGRGDSFLKSASYLMHTESFNDVRSFLIEQSDTIIEDDSGIPVRFFKPDEWKLYPFGNYLQPLGIFPHTYQQQLSQLYRKDHAGALDFGIGYRWRPRESNLLLAVRSGKKTAQGEAPAP